MEKYDVIFCVVTYKNYKDIADFLRNLQEKKNIEFSYKVIIVNNFADDESLKKIKQIALKYNCNFIENENKGYSHGNNLGIEFAKNNYKFDYLVVCNPDTIIKQFNFNSIKEYNKCIIAPEIICLNNNKQNPMYFRYMPLSEKIVYYGFLNRNRFFLLFGILLNKLDRYINRIIMKSLKKKQQKIYACHGSFIIFSNYAIEKLYPVFDNNIFLFCEESDLAQKAKKNGIDIIYTDDIIVIHKEDGSMNFSNNNLNEIQRESYLYYYKKWNTI
ncbi:glycosyltransferase family 2 protein [Thermoanaerobacterium thermosaccharolyticum]|uniref:glycosyltransferase family 2 protein n=1 Tax=Thermoanaerobacterium thermosaccharolyticum TaxID=1517 RepID=UPI00178197CA|nr:glycosyltransferase [Thermoanaerobacterium thermosaccharolyticum]MBE0067690.1 glycosyltransferase family 2 protein [Thermoanaerobacterium thermosaccharolyticum]MBE0228513.1 glycosyltransferase family 2 protein [Thermoanaerobacterium thermosaccharolyticum]